MSIKLGQKVRDIVSGFEGITTAKCEYLNGCVQYGVTPVSTDGKYPDTTYLDYKQLEVIEGGIEVASEDTGGVMINAPR
ncbi:MAG: hypothetical protein LBG15_09395 [Dysgonamonadaceae bacterium]|jgi:hypothetical protein|nr:hypothetical protein [Dysgonamonadaceae bacterium]